MTGFKERYGDWSMVAGAAFGLGEAYCISLAENGINLVLIDQDQEGLLALSQKLDKKYGIQTLRLCEDLSDSESVGRIIKKTASLDVRLLIYNAAFSSIKPFPAYQLNELQLFLKVNINTPLLLIHAFAARLIKKNRSGGILVMSSLAGLLGMQLIAPYAASKAFLWNLSEALHHELKKNNIDVMACIAGATATEAYLKTNPVYGFFKPQLQQPAKVAELALKKMGRKALFIPGFWNRINYFVLLRLLPRNVAGFLANRTIKNMYSNS